MIARAFSTVLVAFAAWLPAAAADDILIADFEGTNYGAWQAIGTAFGPGPAKGTLRGQMPVDGFKGERLVNSFFGGDRSTGTLTSPLFSIERSYVTFLIGGGGYSNETCMNLVVDGATVRTATGPNTRPGGSERLEQGAWDVSDLRGRRARIEIIDRRTDGWGHISVDQLVQTDQRPILERTDVVRDIVAKKKFLHFPVKNGGPRKKVEVFRAGDVVRAFDIELADREPDWWAFLDVSDWQGDKLQIKVDRLREDSMGLASISQDDAIKGADTLYHERLRPQLHFSARRGWNNDPNGLVWHQGEYHLFFQHNPYGWSWGNMHWGHAISRDLWHWREQDEALYPDAMGPMFSGSAVVDWQNTSGFGTAQDPPVVLIYTAAGNPTVQCLAFSTDRGRTFTKYSRNPVVAQITDGNRDPKVFWHEPTHRWIMALYVGVPGQGSAAKQTRHTIHFLTSPNLKEWTVASQIDGFFECPDFFELPVENVPSVSGRNADAPAQKKWVLTAASSEYMVGRFDGRTFTPETPMLPGHRGKGFYAAQTYSDIPASDGRRIQIGWLQAPSPGMSFNQCMSLPLVLKLLPTSDGPRLAWWPVSLPQAYIHGGGKAGVVDPGKTVNLATNTSGLLAVSAEFEPAADSEVTFTVNGVPVIYDAGKQEIVVSGRRAPSPLRHGRQVLLIVSDRTAIEVFTSDGLTYVPMPVTWNEQKLGASVSLRGGALKAQTIAATELKSIWAR